jgi:hypothetical protein
LPKEQESVFSPGTWGWYIHLTISLLILNKSLYVRPGDTVEGVPTLEVDYKSWLSQLLCCVTLGRELFFFFSTGCVYLVRSDSICVVGLTTNQVIKNSPIILEKARPTLWSPLHFLHTNLGGQIEKMYICAYVYSYIQQLVISLWKNLLLIL